MKKFLAFLLVFSLLVGLYIPAGAANDPDDKYIDLSDTTGDLEEGYHGPGNSAGSRTTDTGAYYYIGDNGIIEILVGGVTITGTDNTGTYFIAVDDGVDNLTLNSVDFIAKEEEPALTLFGDCNLILTGGDSELTGGGDSSGIGRNGLDIYTDAAVTITGNYLVRFNGGSGGSTGTGGSGLSLYVGVELIVNGGATVQFYGGNGYMGGFGASISTGASIDVKNGHVDFYGGSGISLKGNASSIDPASGWTYGSGGPTTGGGGGDKWAFENGGQPVAGHLSSSNPPSGYVHQYNASYDDPGYFYLESRQESGSASPARRKTQSDPLSIALKRNFELPPEGLYVGTTYGFSIVGPERGVNSQVYVTGAELVSKTGHNFEIIPDGYSDIVTITITADGFEQVTVEYDVFGGDVELEEEIDIILGETYNPSTGR